MLAVARSLLWELVVRHGAFMLGTFAIANILPIFVIGALSGLNVDLNSVELSILPLSLIPYTVCIVTIAVIAGQGPLRRFYLKPVSNLALTSVFFVSGALLTLFGVWLSIFSWRLFFPIDWPVTRPTLLAVALWAAMHPSLRVSVSKPSRMAELFAVVIVFWFWSLQFHLNARSIDSPDILRGVSLIDVILVVVCMLVGFTMSVYRVGLERSGKSQSLAVKLVKKLGEVWDQQELKGPPSMGPQSAFAWYQWSMRGKPLVFCVSTILLLVAVVHVTTTIISGQSIAAGVAELRQGLTASLLLHIGLAGLSGFFTSFIDDQSVTTLEDGDRVEPERHSVFSEFHSTFPMSDNQMSNAIQLSIAKSIGWSMALLTTVSLLLFSLGTWLGNSVATHDQLSFFTLVGLLVLVAIGSWAAMANGAIVGYALLNRRWRAMPFLVLIALMVVGQAYAFATVSLIATGCVVITCWMYFSSLRSGLISTNLLVTSIGIAVLMFAASYWVCLIYNADWYVPLWAMILTSLTLLPLALMPRLIAKSRHC